MKSQNTIQFVGSDGQPFCERIQKALNDLLPKFHRWFPMIRDETVFTGLLEKTGKRIVDHEKQSGPVERLHGFAWITLRNLSVSELRLSRHKVERASVGSIEGEMLMSRLQTEQDGPRTIEQKLLIEQALQQLTPQERKIALLKKAEYSTAEIAEKLQISPGAVDQAYFRARHKLRKLLNGGSEEN